MPNLSFEVSYIEKCHFCGYCRYITKEEYENSKDKERPCPCCSGNAQWTNCNDNSLRGASK